jgi:hypothetical protein
MMRFCQKCRDYYADGSLGFCLNDGTPLWDVNPLSERWSEGEQVIEEKENALRKQKRRLKWRRFLSSAMTMLIVIMVVCVVAVNSFIYLQPKPEEDDSAKPSILATTPAEPTDSTTPGTLGVPVSIPTLKPKVTPKPTATPIAAEITTRPPTPTPTPRRTPTPAPTQMPTPAPTYTQTASPTPSPRPECSDADKSRERETIIKRFGDRWRRNIEGSRRKIIAENAPADVDNAEATLGTFEYTSKFFKACTAGSVTVRYVWQVRTNFNGTIKVAHVAKEKRFACLKVGGEWLCN